MNLIDLLDEHHRSTLDDEPSNEFLTDGPQDELPDIILKIQDEANSILLTAYGKISPNRCRELASAGYQVSPGEVDSFGWLSGVIHTRVGRIVFG